MSIIPVLKGRDVLQILLKAGFRIISQKGSHIKLRHFIDKSRQVILPKHNKDLKRGTLISILKQAKLTAEEFLKLLKK